MERQVRAMPMRLDVIPAGMESALYPNWTLKLNTKPRGSDWPRPYQTPKDDASIEQSLEEELGANSMFNPLVSSSQSSQPPNPQPSSVPDTTTGGEGPKTPPHFYETPASILPFDLALLGMLAPMSPMTDGENALLNLALGSTVKHTAPPGLGQGMRESGRSSCSDSPMSLGSPAISSSLVIALKVRTQAATPALFDSNEESSEEGDNEEEEMDAMVDSAKD